jgi:hypothetical protein
MNYLSLMRGISLSFLLCSFSISAQTIKHIQYDIENVSSSGVPVIGVPRIQASAFQLFRLDIESLRQQLEGVTYREGVINGFVGHLQLPHTDGTTKTYSVKRNQTMHPDLNALFPEIRSYDAYTKDGSGAYGKWDITPQGLHAMIFIPGQSTIFIDPYIDGNTEYYIVYRKKDFITSKVIDCQVQSMETETMSEPELANIKAMFGSCDLRTYRLAVAATGEYTAFHGGTLALAQAAQVTTMNRVNGVYEKDIAITMVIVPNNNLLVYTNAATDPYTNGTPGTMINQNQTNVNTLIGAANYDIGHVFGTNSGGLAGLGVVCTDNQKARGVTGSSAPVGDPFDIDYVAHEIGHQFGGNHTQNNSCNSVAAARREPGSASTIMGYAGICAPNVQNNSDDYFHGYNLGEISNEILSNGHTCEVLTSLNNTPPVIASTNGNVTVPANTPFALTAIASDVDGDQLTYLWEQMNNQASTQPPLATATGGPNFRSFDPDTLPTRYFPKLSALANNGPFTWEVIPSVTRTMNFRVSVKDNHAVGSCNDYTDVTLSTTSAAGPFIVTYPDASGISWAENSTQTVTWDVANTDVAPVNCSSVRILLSIDGGLTYPYELNAGTPNDGSQSVLVPSTPTITARIMVISAAGTFFDISNNNFAITACVQPETPSLNAISPTCYGDDATLTITAGNLNDATQWEWFSGSCNGTPIGTGTSLNVNPTATTTYFAIGTGGCAGSTCGAVTVSVPAQIDNNVTQNGILLSSNQNGATYQWIDCNNSNSPLAGETNQSYATDQLTGSYAVVVTMGACSDTSTCFSVDQSGIADIANAFINVQPNPFIDMVTVNWTGIDIENIELTDAAGKLIYSETINSGNNSSIQTAGMSKGVYFIRLIGTNGTLVRQLIKQ